jgi:hypothetical protein
VIVKPFKPYHIDLLRAQGVQGAQLRELSLVPEGTVINPHGQALTVFDGETVIVCGGIIPKFKGHGECWAILSAEAGRHMRWLHYAAKRFISIEPWSRLEATVEEGFENGCRWVELLGFKFEGRSPKYGPNGETHLRYGRT